MTLRPCPIGFFCIPDKLVGDGSGRKGRIFTLSKKHFQKNNDIDELILNEIDSLIESDISVIELMGIKIRKDLYKWLYLSLQEDDKLYRELLFARTEKNNLPEGANNKTN